MRVTIRRTIAAPPKLVFAVYTDASRLREWQPGLRRVIERTGPLDQAGTNYVLDQAGPRLSISVLAVDGPRLHRQLEKMRWYRWIGTARFDPLPGDGTHFSYEYEPQVRRLGWLLLPLMTASALVALRSEFDRLKAVAERIAAGQAGASGDKRA